ncbi:MAG: type I methionyl aminopeptidase [Defluviitaleaceae bacterium]|nr:type I methionyl aminopeptidase [Defluviitaleaceae bacterium]
MSIILKNKFQADCMREAGKVVFHVHEALEKAIKPGITTKELDDICAQCLKEHGAISSFFGYEGSFGAGPYPGNACISLNEEVIHGLPGLRKLRSGDIVSIDVGAYKNGFHGDAARTYIVGDVLEEDKKLIRVTEESFFKGLEFVKPGKRLYEVSGAIQDYIQSNGFSVVRDYVGHGIGKALHESPEIPNYRPKDKGGGVRLVPGMTLAIEPMVNTGVYAVKVLDDLWTVVTKDGKNSAHYENTVLVTDGEPEILTML